ncbi:MAG: hypothetical protein LCH81_21210 [Bacteroidetes bacterium]|nr:hypothetical protein [Bacteroidota bacterium]
MKSLVLPCLLLVSIYGKSQSFAPILYGGIRSEDEFWFREKEFRFYVPDEPNGRNIYIDRIRRESAFGMAGIAHTDVKGNIFELSGSFQFNHGVLELFTQFDSTQVPYEIISRAYGTTETKGFDIQFGYHIKLLKNVPDLKWRRYIGVFLNYSFASMKFNPVYENVYPLERSKNELSVGFTPHLQRNITKKLFLDLSASFFVINRQLDFTAIRNPALSKRQQENTVLDGGILNRCWFRAGIGWTLFSKE